VGGRALQQLGQGGRDRADGSRGFPQLVQVAANAEMRAPSASTPSALRRSAAITAGLNSRTCSSTAANTTGSPATTSGLRARRSSAVNRATTVGLAIFCRRPLITWLNIAGLIPSVWASAVWVS